MKALILSTPDGPESVALQEVDIPEPGQGEVRVRLRAASLNHRELFISRGQYPDMKLPSILGADGAGVIDAVGGGVDPALIGREVVLYPARNWGDNPAHPSKDFCLLGMPLPGTLAEYICVPAEHALPKPAHLDFDEAACVPLAALTAWRALTVKAGVKAGEKVLITGIGGGVATWALSFALAHGAEVYVTSGSAEKIEQAIALGAKGGVNYRDEKWGRELARLSGGIDIVIDGAPSGSASEYMRTLNLGARVVIYGSTGGVNIQFLSPDLFLRHATLYGTAMGTLEDCIAMLEFVAEHRLQPVIDRRFTLENAKEALLYMQSGSGIGKIVVTIDGPKDNV